MVGDGEWEEPNIESFEPDEDGEDFEAMLGLMKGTHGETRRDGSLNAGDADDAVAGRNIVKRVHAVPAVLALQIHRTTAIFQDQALHMIIG